MNAPAPKVSFVSLGCPKALVDSERIITQLRAQGYELTKKHHGADVVIVNTCGFLDSAKAESLDAIGQDPDAEPLHVVRFGHQINAQGVLADSPQSRRLIGYLTKYLVKQVAECHIPKTEAQREHVDRLAEALRYEPCSPTCANWLRYGITIGALVVALFILHAWLPA